MPDDVDKFFSEMIRDLKTLSEQELEVGWFDDDIHQVDNDTHASPRTMAYVAYVNEMGAFKRPFFEPAIFENEEEWLSLFSKTDSSVALETLGEKVIEDVRGKIDGEHRPLSPVTLAVRRMREDGKVITNSTVNRVGRMISEGKTYPSPSRTDPLNETGQLYDNIKAKLTK